MPAIVDIIIKKTPLEVWSVIADATTHPQWLGQDSVTVYQDAGELAEGMKFTRLNKLTGVKTECEVVAVKPAQFLKVRVDSSQDSFATTEYHLLTVSDGCALRVLGEIYDTGEARHVYFPEMMEEQWQSNLERLKRYCEVS